MADEKDKQQQQNLQEQKSLEKNTRLKAAKQPEEGTIVKMSDKMWIKGTGASKHLAKDSVHEVNRISGQKLISKGAAVETTAPKPKAAPKKATAKDEEDE